MTWNPSWNSSESWPAAVLDSYEQAVAVIDHTDALVYANRAARDLLTRLGGGGPLSFANAARELKLSGKSEVTIEMEVAGDGKYSGRAWALNGAVVAVSLAREVDPADRIEKLRSNLRLSSREAQLALHACDGKSNKNIAELYSVPVGTIATRFWRLYRKLGVRNRAELASVVANAGRPPSPPHRFRRMPTA